VTTTAANTGQFFTNVGKVFTGQPQNPYYAYSTNRSLGGGGMKRRTAGARSNVWHAAAYAPHSGKADYSATGKSKKAAISELIRKVSGLKGHTWSLVVWKTQAKTFWLYRANQKGKVVPLGSFRPASRTTTGPGSIALLASQIMSD
jgi:hypothetical protein